MKLWKDANGKLILGNRSSRYLSSGKTLLILCFLLQNLLSSLHRHCLILPLLLHLLHLDEALVSLYWSQSLSIQRRLYRTRMLRHILNHSLLGSKKYGSVERDLHTSLILRAASTHDQLGQKSEEFSFSPSVIASKVPVLTHRIVHVRVQYQAD